MTTVTIYNIAEAIENTFTAAGVFTKVQANEALQDGMQDALTIQIYPEEIIGDAKTRSDRMTMGAKVRQTDLVFNVDVYARQRSHIGEDMKAVADAADAVIAVLEGQDATPPFSLAGLKTFHWRASRVIFEYGDPQTRYVGLRFTLTFSIF